MFARVLSNLSKQVKEDFMAQTITYFPSAILTCCKHCTGFEKKYLPSKADSRVNAVRPILAV